jgi:DNA (cytosine-5)-methyltransferase 1
MALVAMLGGSLAWVADNDPSAAIALKTHHPDVPNLGDITNVDFTEVEQVEILCAGFPCQDVSCAGARAGLGPGTRTGVWSHVARAIAELRPPYVFLENVRGLTSAKAHSDLEYCPGCMGDREDRIVRACGVVFGDLASLGYDAEWHCVRASEVGAPHRRERIFILAWPRAADTQSDPRWS